MLILSSTDSNKILAPCLWSIVVASQEWAAMKASISTPSFLNTSDYSGS